MNENFFKLSKEKQVRIINAGLEVFGKHEYKHAITDNIAFKAGISKGLLFHYFENKKSFYMFLFTYCKEKVLSEVIDDSFYQITDFFEMIRYGAKKKMKILNTYPFVMEFILRAYYSLNESISDDINRKMQKETALTYDLYFSKVDFTPFKEGIDPKRIYDMLIWMCDGYLHEKQRLNIQVSMEEMMKEFSEWESLFKKMIYKEEFQ